MYAYRFYQRLQMYTDSQVCLGMGAHAQAVNTRPSFSPPTWPGNKATEDEYYQRVTRLQQMGDHLQETFTADTAEELSSCKLT